MEITSEYQSTQDGRWFVILEDFEKIPRAHYVWRTIYPDDPILDGEVIHHKNENKEDDSPENLVKMTAFEHKSMHGNVGAAALKKWRKENPEKARKLSQDNMRKAHATMLRRKNGSLGHNSVR